MAQIECMLNPRLSEEFKWGFFVNWRGGDGNNIQDDMAQEIFNRFRKSVVQIMAPNKSFKSISKVCKATNGFKEVKEQFDTLPLVFTRLLFNIPLESLKDEKEMVADLIQLDPFKNVAGRCHDSFPEIKRCPLRYLNIVEFHQWLDKHKREVSNRN